MRRTIAAALLGFIPFSAPAAAQAQGRAVTADLSAPDAPSSPAIAEMRARARAEGRISVIVMMGRGLDLGAAVTPQARADQARGLVAAQTALARRVHQDLRTLDPADLFENIPAIVLEVDPNQFERLLRDGAVASIELVQPMNVRPRLKEMREITKIEKVWPADRGAKGDGELIAIVDEGLDSDIAEVKGRVVKEACSSSSNRCFNANDPQNRKTVTIGQYAGWTCSEKPDQLHAAGRYCNQYSHGATVSIVSAGSGVGAGDFAGFGPKLDIFFVRAALGYTTNASFAKAFDLALTGANTRRPTVITTSLGFTDFRDDKLCTGVNLALEEVLGQARKLGIPVMNSAGNDEGSKIDYPACHPLVFAVGASTEKTEDLASFSDVNDMVDVLAPGDSVKFAAGEKETKGTSFTTPAVAGAIALLRHAFPAKTPVEILTGLRCTGKWVKQTDRDRPYSSVPRIDVEAAYEFLSKPSVPAREFSFDAPEEIATWSLGNGVWKVAGGRLTLDVLKQKFATTSAVVDQCFENFYVEASMRKLFKSKDPLPDYDTNEGELFLTTTASGASKLTDAAPLSGYEAGFWRSDTPSTGQVALLRVKNYTHDPSKLPADFDRRVLCGDQAAKISLGGYEKLGVLKRGSKLTLYFNGRKVCSVDMAADATGAVGVVRGVGFYSVQNGTSTITQNVNEIEYLRIEPR